MTSSKQGFHSGPPTSLGGLLVFSWLLLLLLWESFCTGGGRVLTSALRSQRNRIRLLRTNL
ncbi:hypothetical protein CRUP_010974 [Coryphaenoides rupestris]|nr:hypothetical protein CRUP_010974 [Coryphaenoides rupestris]